MTKEPAAAEDPAAKRNFALLALYQVLMRTGWIFKTESIIMPAVLDTLSGAAWLRGALPLLNRLGQSLPPLMVAGLVRRMPQKKWLCSVSVALMSATFVGMAFIWVVPEMETQPSAPILFLTCYGLFFVFLGVNQLCQLTLQGKLLIATRRGWLLSVANGVGAVTSVACAVLLLPMWLREDEGDFEHLFLFTAALFAAGGVAMLMLSEPNDEASDRREHTTSPLGLAWRTLERNVAFRRAALVGLLYGTSTILFPHYQRMAQLEHPDLRRMIWWVAIQNIGTGLFSVPIGMIHERFGTRLVLRISMFGICLIPPTALYLANAGEWAEPWYNIVFLLIGLSPVMLRALSDYTLEVSPQEDHPQYLGTMNLCISAPILASIPAGWLMDAVGFGPVFVAVTVLLVIGWFCTFALSEPRKRVSSAGPLPPLDTESAT